MSTTLRRPTTWLLQMHKPLHSLERPRSPLVLPYLAVAESKQWQLVDLCLLECQSYKLPFLLRLPDLVNVYALHS